MSTETLHIEPLFAGNSANPLIVLSHGTMDRSAGMLRLSRVLKEDFYVLRYDRRGYGRSAGVGPPFGATEHVGDLAALLDRHASGRSAALVFGHSYGGNVALGLAEQRPDLVDAVAVYETPMSWMPSWPRNTAGAAAVGAGDPADSAEAFMRRLIGDAIWERLPPSTRAARRSEGPALMGELLDLRRCAPWTADNISVPVLALCGEEGRPHHRSGTKTLAAMLPMGQYGQVAGAGHGAPNSHAAELAQLLADFVSSRAD